MDIRAFMNKEPQGAVAAWHSTTDMLVGGWEMTPCEEPLQCRCGDHSAKYVPAKKKEPPRWMVMAVKAGPEEFRCCPSSSMVRQHFLVLPSSTVSLFVDRPEAKSSRCDVKMVSWCML
jgi:hypothetical protein